MGIIIIIIKLTNRDKFSHMQVKNTPRIACLEQVNINRSVIIEKSKRRNV